MNTKILFTFLAIVLSLAFILGGVSATLCYQETANESNARDNHCGLNYSGGYNIDENFQTPYNLIDGDWTTLDRVVSGGPYYFYINYTKPASALSAIWTTDNSQPPFPTPRYSNFSINESNCWNTDATKLILRGYSQGFGTRNSGWDCYNGTDWRNLWNESYYSGNGGYLYEEGMYWDVTPPTQTMDCYQETANQSTASDGSNCGLNYTGTYSIFTSGYTGILYVNYTKPKYAIDAVWSAKFGDYNNNYTILSSCYNYNPNKIFLSFYQGIDGGTGNHIILGQCYNGTWNTITDITDRFTGDGSSGASPLSMYDGNWDTGVMKTSSSWYYDYAWPYASFYEEAIIWKVNLTLPLLVNQTDNNGTLTNSGNATFNITVINSNTTVILYIDNSTNIATNYIGDDYYVTKYFDSPGTYPYYWSSYGSGVYANYNQSETSEYVIILSSPSGVCSSLFNLNSMGTTWLALILVLIMFGLILTFVLAKIIPLLTQTEGSSTIENSGSIIALFVGIFVIIIIIAITALFVTSICG